MKIVLFISVLLTILFSGCSSVPLEPKEISDQAKLFSPPPQGKAGLYVYRNSFVGQALKKDLWIDNKCLGETAVDIFFYQAVDADTTHTIATESEFSANKMDIRTENGKNYFIRQYIKMGAFVGGADLEVVEEEQAKTEIADLDMAIKGTCSKPTPDSK